VTLYSKEQLSDDFDADVVAVGNWNTVDRYDAVKRERVETPMGNLPKRLGEALERIGVELDWSDCTTTCDDCGKLLNTNPHCYGWQPSYVMTEHSSLTCKDCLDPSDYLEGLEGDPDRALNLDSIDPADHGYTLLEDGFESGWHPGQDASPKKIAEALRKRGIERFLFRIDDIGQFDSKFSVWVHEDEENADEVEELTTDEVMGPSNSEALKRGLSAASDALARLPPGEGVKYAAIQGDTATDVRVISPQDFIEKRNQGMSRGIDYGRGLANVDTDTGIRYGVIPIGAVDWWHEQSEAQYPEPQCPDCEGEVTDDVPDSVKPGDNYVSYYCAECEKAFTSEECEAQDPSCFTVAANGLQASQNADGGDIFVLASPYFTRAAFCSPCAPGACYLTSPCDDGERAYCFGHEWFEGKAPYPVYRVDTGLLVEPPKDEASHG
jgi:hypothetical protein